MKARVHIIFFLFLGNVFYTLRAQEVVMNIPVKMLVYQNLNNDSVLKAFERRFHQMDSLMEDIRILSGISIEQNDNCYSLLDSLYLAKEKNEVKAFKRKNGLELTGQVYQRLDNTLSFDDEDQYSAYATKLQGEVGWNFFNSSFFQRKSELRYIRLANELQYLQQSKEQLAVFWMQIQRLIDEYYNHLIAVVLYQQLKNVDILNQAYQYVLERDRVSNDKLLDAMNEKMRIEYELVQLSPLDSIRQEPLFLLPVTVVEMDTVRLFQELIENQLDIKASYVKEGMLDTKKKLTNYAQEMRLTPFLRASHYLREHSSPSTNIDLGVRFTFPLYDDTHHKRKALQTEKFLLAVERETFSMNVMTHIRILLKRLEQLNKTVETENYHQKQLKKYIGIRKEAYGNAMHGYNQIVRLEEYNEYLKSIERMYKLMYARNLCLLDIQKAAGIKRLEIMVNERIIK